MAYRVPVWQSESQQVCVFQAISEWEYVKSDLYFEGLMVSGINTPRGHHS